MRVILKTGLAVSDNLGGNRVWASGETVDELLADCERAFWRYKKHKEKRMRSVESWEGFVVESARFIPTGQAGQGGAHNNVPCVQVTPQVDGSYRANLAHLDPLRSNGAHLCNFMKRLGLFWAPVYRYRRLGMLEPIFAVDYFTPVHDGTAAVKVNRFVLPFHVSLDTLQNMLGEERRLQNAAQIIDYTA